MKALRTIGLWFMLLLLLPAAGRAEADPTLDSMTLEAIAQIYWDADNGLTEFVNSLESTYGAIRYWSPEKQYWFTSILPSLIDLEKQKVETYHPGWSNMSFSRLDHLLAHRYGLPDENNLSEEDAKAKAIEWVTAHQILSADDIASCRIGSSFYCDDPSRPMWVFRFYPPLGGGRGAEIWMTADDGVFAQSNALDIREIAEEYLLSTHPVVAMEEFTAHDLGYCYVDTFFHPETSMWTIQIVAPNIPCDWTVQIEDTTRQVVDMESGNG